jgi:hypothetical protein
MLAAYTILHVLISLVAIATGFVVMYGMLTAQRLDRWTAVFLVTTAATSLTGFGFPVDHFMPSHAIGILSLLVLAVAAFARYGRQMAGIWRPIYVVSTLVGQYFDVFVLVIQSFQKVPPLRALAPTQSEPPFAVVQLVVLLAFVVVGVMAVIRFRPAAEPAVS